MAEKSDKKTTHTGESLKVHPNTFSYPSLPVLPSELPDIRLPFSVMRALQTICGIEIPIIFLNGDSSPVITTTSCTLELFLQIIGASKPQINCAIEMGNSQKLPAQFQLTEFFGFIKKYKEGKITYISNLSTLVKEFLNLFRNKVKKSKAQTPSDSFLKSESAPCATFGVAKKSKKKDETSKQFATELINDILTLVMSSSVEKASAVKPYDFLQEVALPDAMCAFILAVMTTDLPSDTDDKQIDSLQVLNGLEESSNVVVDMFTMKLFFNISLAFWKAHIQESKKMDALSVSSKDVEAYMLDFLRRWGAFEWNGNRKASVITRLFNDIMHGIALLSASFDKVPNLETISLSIIHQVLINVDQILDVELNGEFFQMVGECLGFPQICDNEQSFVYDLNGVEERSNDLNSSWGKLCYRAGLSLDRDKILEFLMTIYKKDHKHSFHILRTFISSGKTSGISLLMLSKFLPGETAVFMTPCPSEVLNFFAGIKFQIKNLVACEAFKSLKKDDKFKVYMLNMISRLDKLRVFESPLSLGQTLDRAFISIFVLAPTHANILWLLGNNYDNVVLDDIDLAGDIAKCISIRGNGCGIIVSGADVGDFNAYDFLENGYIVNVCDIQKKINTNWMWEDAILVRDDAAFKALERMFSTSLTRGVLKYSDLGGLFQRIGISIKGNVNVSSNPILKFRKIVSFLKYIAVDPTSAFQKFCGLYEKEMLNEYDSKSKKGDTSIVYQTGDETFCILTLLSSLKVEDATYVAPTFSIVLDLLNDGRCDSAFDEEGNSKSHAGSGATIVNTDNTDNKKDKKDKKKDNKKVLANVRKKGEDELPSSSENVPTRPATMDDIRLRKPVAQNPRRYTPSKQQLTEFKRLLKELKLPEEYQSALFVLFENGVGRVSREFPPDYNEFVASVFRKKRISCLSTNYPLESMNLGHVSAVIVMSSISERDMRQLLGRMDRPNSGSLLQMLEDGRLILLVFDEACKDDHRGLVCGAGVGPNLDFSSVMNLGEQVGISQNISAVIQVLNKVFAESFPMFPIEFQRRIENLFLASIFRAFHRDMHFSDKTLLERDFACVIAMAVDPLRIPTKASTKISSILIKLFGKSGANMEAFFGEGAHLMLILSAKNVSELQGFDSPDAISEVLAELLKVYHALECAICVVSMTTPILDTIKQVSRERMNVIATLLSKTADHLQRLMTLFDTKRTTMLHNHAKSEAKLGAVVSEIHFSENAIAFSSAISQLIEEISNRRVTVRQAQDAVIQFTASLNQYDAFDKHIIELASLFNQSLNTLSELYAQCEVLFRSRAVLVLRGKTATNGKNTANMFSLLMKLKQDEKGVTLGIQSVIKKGTFQFQEDAKETFCMLRAFLITSEVLNGDVCNVPQDFVVSKESFDALKRAIETFNENEKHEHKFLYDVKKSENDPLIAQISVEIDQLDQKIARFLAQLRRFTKMA